MTSMQLPHLTSKVRGTYSHDYGTPRWIINLIKDVYDQPIHVDLASSEKHNKVVDAAYYFTDTDSADYSRLGYGLVFCNPPGPGKLVHKFWDIWLGLMEQRRNSGVFFFFNVDHMRRAVQNIELDLEVLLLRDRVRFEGADSGASWPSALVFTRRGMNRELMLDNYGTRLRYRGIYDY